MIFALSAFVFVGMCAVVVDVAWYWANTLRVQRAADAAALAGAVLLPGKVNTGPTTRTCGRRTRRRRTATRPPAAASRSRRSRTRSRSPAGTPASSTSRSRRPSPRSSCACSASTRSTPPGPPRRSTSCPSRWEARRTTTASGCSSRQAESTGLKSGLRSVGRRLDDPGERGRQQQQPIGELDHDATGATQSWGTFGLLTAPTPFPAGATVDGIEVQVRRELHAGTGTPSRAAASFRSSSRGTAARAGRRPRPRATRRSPSAPSENLYTPRQRDLDSRLGRPHLDARRTWPMAGSGSPDVQQADLRQPDRSARVDTLQVQVVEPGRGRGPCGRPDRRAARLRRTSGAPCRARARRTSRATRS